MSFTYSHTMEPHHRRRLELIAQHPEIRALMGYDRKTIAVTFGVVAAQLALAVAVQRSGLSWLSAFLLAYAVGAVLSHWAGQTIHETAHNLGARTRRGNQALAL